MSLLATRRSRLATCGSLLAWLVTSLVLGGGAAAQQRKTFRSSIDVVNFNVFVVDKKGAPITGLKAEDFEILESGKPQKIEFFAEGDPEDAPPLHVAFMLDASGSMDKDLDDVRTAAIKFLKGLENAADLTLVDFDTEVNIARFAPEDFPRLIERIRNRKTGDMTAFYDALGNYLNRAMEIDGQKIVIMYTDGVDTRSELTHTEAVDLVRASDVTVYAIGYLEHHTQTTRLEQRTYLQRFAEMTGGQAFFPSTTKDIDRAYEKIHQDIAARYSVGYTSSDSRTDGAWRKVEVRLKRPDLKGAKVRTRDGYYAPYRKAP